MTRPRIIAVLGMHRSGTSAIARGLKTLGVDLGDNLMPPVEGNNDKGFWEDMDFYQFNERLLRKAGNAWDHLSLVEADRLAQDEFAAERYEAAALIERKLGDTNAFGFKDPRTAPLLPFWRCIFSDLGVDDHYLLALRNPLEVAESLRKRDNLDPAHGLALWLKYNWAAIKYSEGRKRVCVSYSRLMNDPVAELGRVATAFDLSMPSTTSPEYTEYAEEFLTPSLRHIRISDNEVLRSSAMPSILPQLFSALSEWASASAEQELSLPTKLKAQVEAFWSANEPLLHLGDRLYIASAKSRAALAQSEQARATLANESEKLKLSEAELKKTLAESAARIAAQFEKITAQAGRLTALEQELHSAREDVKTKELNAAYLDNELKEKAEAVRRLSHEVSEHKKAAGAAQEARQAELNVVTEKLAAQSAQLLEAQAKISDQDQRLEALQHHLSELETIKSAEAEERTAKLEAVTAEFTALKARLATLGSEKATADAELEAVTAELTALKARLATLGSEKATADAELNAATTQLAAQAKLAAEREQNISRELSTALATAVDLKTELQDKVRDLRLARHDLLNLRTDMRERSTEASIQIQAAEDKASRRASELASASTRIDALTQEISILRTTVSKWETEARDMSQQLKTAEQHLTSSKATIEASQIAAQEERDRVTELQCELLEKAKTIELLTSEVLELRSSTSWRVTKPLRMTRSLLTQPHRVFIRLFRNDQTDA